MDDQEQGDSALSTRTHWGREFGKVERRTKPPKKTTLNAMLRGGVEGTWAAVSEARVSL